MNMFKIVRPGCPGRPPSHAGRPRCGYSGRAGHPHILGADLMLRVQGISKNPPRQAARAAIQAAHPYDDVYQFAGRPQAAQAVQVPCDWAITILVKVIKTNSKLLNVICYLCEL